MNRIIFVNGRTRGTVVDEVCKTCEENKYTLLAGMVMPDFKDEGYMAVVEVEIKEG